MKSLSHDFLLLPFVGALLQVLDEDQQPLIPDTFASGFIRREGERFFLYTCWHVVTGFNPNDIKIGLTRPTGRYLKVDIQAQRRAPGVEVIGGLNAFVLPLYDESTQPIRPLWLQDDRHVSHPDLNAIGLYVPFWHDAIKLELPSEIQISDMQIIDDKRLVRTPVVAVGEKCLVVGYPYGFSAFGPAQPTPIVLTRFIAGDRIANRRQQLLLESIGAPGMSGGPVFIERDDELLLLGIYTGLLFPDYPRQNKDVTALGTVSNLSLVFSGVLPLVAVPSEMESPSTEKSNPTIRIAHEISE